MNTRFFTGALAAASLLAGSAAHAQTATPDRRSETIVLKQGDDRPQTTIEIQGGTVVVNGDTVARAGDRGAKKVIIDRDSDGPLGGGSRGGMFGMPPGGPARKARLGVMTDPAKSTGGAYVQEVQPGTPAAKAGLKAGDKITKVDNVSIENARDLVETIGTHDPDDSVRVTYSRNGSSRTVMAQLESPEDDGSGSMRSFGFGGPGMDLSESFRGLLGGDGALFGNRNDAKTPKLGVVAEDRADGTGVRLLEVKPDGAAAKAGLKEDDVVTELGGTKVASVDELQRTVRSMQGEETTIRYQRSGKAASARITIPKVLRKRDL